MAAQDNLKFKEEAINDAIRQIEKAHGKGAIIPMGLQKPHIGIEVIRSGSLSLDLALGVGGLPVGRIIEIYGAESSGKTTLALSCMAQASGRCAFIDVEHALDPVYAAKLGVNIDRLLLSQPDSGEQALEIVDTLVRSAAIDVIVVDSVAALTPKAEIEGDMGDSHMGLQARLMSQALRKLTAIISRTKTLLIFINQTRMKIGVVFGNPETTTGGNALKFYASVRLEVRKGSPIKNGDVTVGSQTKVKVVKNKVAPPFRVAEFDIMYGEGISRLGEVIDLGVTCGALDKSGSWFSFKGQKIGQGREGVKRHLKENPHLVAEIEERIKQDLSGLLANTTNTAEQDPTEDYNENVEE